MYHHRHHHSLLQVGASRALDYAVVDLYFAALLAFLSSKAMLEAEGVDLGQYATEAGARLAQVGKCSSSGLEGTFIFRNSVECSRQAISQRAVS